MEHDSKSMATALHTDQNGVDDKSQVINADSYLEQNNSEQEVGIPASRRQGSASITMLAPELIHEIMSHLTPSCFKFSHPDAIVSLSTDNEWSTHLDELLETWMGPQYRCASLLSLSSRRHYLRRSVYGENHGYQPTSAELDLESRYRDFDRSIMRGPIKVDGNDGDLVPSQLPNPFNKGYAWDDEAIAIIERDLLKHKYIGSWVKTWEEFRIWQAHQKHFHDIGTFMEARKVLSEGRYTEWIDMIGF
ncbi:hypothetical protein NHQ30_011602 [Ciborinia camelliae]|nr:hypothetical protein NHQ30_011602 [Ciborinia camelliae]